MCDSICSPGVPGLRNRKQSCNTMANINVRVVHDTPLAGPNVGGRN